MKVKCGVCHARLGEVELPAEANDLLVRHAAAAHPRTADELSPEEHAEAFVRMQGRIRLAEAHEVLRCGRWGRA